MFCRRKKAPKKKILNPKPDTRNPLDLPTSEMTWGPQLPGMCRARSRDPQVSGIFFIFIFILFLFFIFFLHVFFVFLFSGLGAIGFRVQGLGL